jgi:FOG: WD40 repeat
MLLIENKENVLSGHTDAVTSLAVTSDHKFIISGSNDCTIGVWNFFERRLERVLDAHNDSVRVLTVSYDNTFFVSGSLDRSIKV